VSKFKLEITAETKEEIFQAMDYLKNCGYGEPPASEYFAKVKIKFSEITEGAEVEL
jgi:hypothetical protein